MLQRDVYDASESTFEIVQSRIFHKFDIYAYRTYVLTLLNDPSVFLRLEKGFDKLTEFFMTVSDADVIESCRKKHIKLSPINNKGKKTRAKPRAKRSRRGQVDGEMIQVDPSTRLKPIRKPVPDEAVETERAHIRDGRMKDFYEFMIVCTMVGCGLIDDSFRQRLFTEYQNSISLYTSKKTSSQEDSMKKTLDKKIETRDTDKLKAKPKKIANDTDGSDTDIEIQTGKQPIIKTKTSKKQKRDDSSESDEEKVKTLKVDRPPIPEKELAVKVDRPPIPEKESAVRDLSNSIPTAKDESDVENLPTQSVEEDDSEVDDDDGSSDEGSTEEEDSS